MLHQGLSHRDREALWESLFDSHRIKIRVHILNSFEEPVNDFDFHFGTTHVLSGAVQVDATQDVTRSLSMTFLDPYRRFRWSPDHASRGTMYSGDFLRVIYSVHVSDDNLPVSPSSTLGPKTTVGRRKHRRRKRWIDLPVFWGFLSAYEANGAEITIEAQGKEALLMNPHFATSYKLDKNQRIDHAMEEVLNRAGELRTAIPELNYRLKKDRVIRPRDEPWKIIQGGEDDSGAHVAGLINRSGKYPHHAYFDGLGRFCVRRINEKDPVFTFDKSNIVNYPDVTYDSLEWINTVVVHGAKPSGKGKGKKPVFAKVSLPADHPLSPQSMARKGRNPTGPVHDVPRELTLHIDAENLKTEKECRDRAIHILDNKSQIGVDASFECLPVPILEENDWVRVKLKDNLEISFPLRQFTIPLTADQTMSIGENKQIPIGPRVRGAAGPPGGAGHGAARGGSGGAGPRGGGQGGKGSGGKGGKQA